MKPYVAGLLFDKTRQQVALVRKARPEWQAGKWNAIGGKVEPDEFAEGAMIREFREETGVEIEDWTYILAIYDPLLEWVVYFFAAFSDDVFNVRTTTDEEIKVFPVAELPGELVAKVKWILPLSLAKDVEFPLKPVKHIGECS